MNQQILIFFRLWFAFGSESNDSCETMLTWMWCAQIFRCIRCGISLPHWLAAAEPELGSYETVPLKIFFPLATIENQDADQKTWDFCFVPEAAFLDFWKLIHSEASLILPSQNSSLVPQHLQQNWSSWCATAAPPDQLSLPGFLAHCSWGNLFCSSTQSIVHIPEIICSHLGPGAP